MLPGSLLPDQAVALGHTCPQKVPISIKHPGEVRASRTEATQVDITGILLLPGFDIL
jgi:hypothetical protein